MTYPAAPRTPEQAIDWAEAQHAGWGGMCLSLVRQAYGVPGVYSAAIDQWRAPGVRHETSNLDHIPRGAPLFMWSNTSTYQHVALYLGDGNMRTTSSSQNQVMTVPVSSWYQWGWSVLGWREDLEGYRVIDADGSPPGDDNDTDTTDPEPEDDDMPENVSKTKTTDHNVAADHEWHTINISDEGALQNLLSGKAYFDATLSLTITTTKDYRVQVRAVQVDISSNKGDHLASTAPRQDFHCKDGTNELVYSMTGHVGEADHGYDARRLRFQIKGDSPNRNGTMRVTYTNARALVWKG